MKTITPIILLASLAPTLSLAHPGHEATELVSMLSTESIELMLAAFAVAMLLSTTAGSMLRGLLARIRNRLVKRR